MSESREQTVEGQAAEGQAAGRDAKGRKSFDVHPLLMLLSVLLAAALLTYLLDSGTFQREGPQIVPGSYQPVPKAMDWAHVLGTAPAVEGTASPAGITTVLNAIPKGLARSAPLIFMVMFVGGMFGVFKRTGALDAGLDHLVHHTRGNVYLLAPVLMLVLAAGSSFMGLISEYLVVLPVLLSMADRLRLDRLFAVAMLLIAAKIGYVASVSNPVALPIAQGIVGEPIFSGFAMRLAVLVVFISVGIGYLLYRIRRSGFTRAQFDYTAQPMSRRKRAVLLVIGVSVGLMIYAGQAWDWHHTELGAFYIAVAVLIAAVGGVAAGEAADAFIDGMKGMVLPGVLIGLAGAIQMVLQHGMILDTVVNGMTRAIDGHSPWMSAVMIMHIEAALDVLISSTSAKAAISLPILWPIGQLSGLTGNTVVLAFLLGNGLMSMVSPTSGLMLAMLAMAKTPYGRWLRFVLPLTLSLAVLAIDFLFVATALQAAS
ncbi:YfcC family protein [Marilutibacter maris]|uniref:YfcC family protein n=1 Tax=Marilutibacter maris TaxID=1605891 RepID=UPI00167F103E|nr:YfcC family protein [Lysobacter maris]